jgi:hypothetical protein
MSFSTLFADFLANAKTIDTSLPNEGSHRITVRKIKDVIRLLGEQSYPGVEFLAGPEIQYFDVFPGTPSGGTFTLTFPLFGGVRFTTAPIAFDADGATIQSAIDAAAPGHVPDYQPGDISTGSPANGDGDGFTVDGLSLYFTGNSVSFRNQGLTIIDAANVTGGGTPANLFEGDGRPLRYAYAVLVVLGILGMPAPAHGATSGFVVKNGRGNFPHSLDDDTVRALVREVGVSEGSAAVEAALLKALGF